MSKDRLPTLSLKDEWGEPATAEDAELWAVVADLPGLARIIIHEGSESAAAGFGPVNARALGEWLIKFADRCDHVEGSKP